MGGSPTFRTLCPSPGRAGPTERRWTAGRLPGRHLQGRPDRLSLGSGSYAGWNSTLDNAAGITTGAGVFGPQGQDTFGLAGAYTFFPGLQLHGEWANSRYQSNKKSPYTSNGQALRVDVSGKLFDDSLTLVLAYLSVDPDFSPALWNNPHNRQGFQFRGQWNFDAKNGNFWTRVAKWQQRRTSVYDLPYLGFQHKLTEKSELGATLRHYHTVDMVDPAVQPAASSANIGSSAHPFSWQGWQLVTNYSLKF